MYEEMTREEFNTKIGESMRTARENRGLTRTSVAFEMGIPVTRYADIENGNADITTFELYLYMMFVHPDAVSDNWLL